MPANNYGVYLFRHIQTNQILVSLRQNMKNKALHQLGNTNRPVRLRKDLWRPLVALTGFNTPQSAQAVSDALLHRSKAKRDDLRSSPEYLSRPKRLRIVDEMNMVENSVISLREALETVGAKNEQKLLALWEQPRFMELKGDKDWPSFLEHGQLVLKNNRFVKEEEAAAVEEKQQVA
ncbi:hypothetical protein G6F70_004882 [Rhizopus microsporus]|uniref:Large ribosomal subunit protein mL67 n=1 Tax=Rhizopus microsporus TaxID=58291 RepID=A0A1X0RQL7_RHIZD|nr:hypothetical protein G6F71_006450 [Rhizopus microsporus]KAG1199476.1 hypothetical protein G6F70_004882 [Rhizopus microsporus]KAG1209279.1 hypothetical protein G6F69_006492 [Rhizopus microsporus]KAG1230749.1 hypothetical protein G6F67_006247 [Rhizopus microsporus]KAG1262934.1 hypothetical protein G6F68_005556 [Rhizopus microsporus]